MKYCRLFLAGLILFSSCRSSKTAIDTVVVVKKMSAKKVSKKHIANAIDKQTIDAKLKVHFKDNQNKQKLIIRLRIKKDKLIWINGTVMGLLVFRAKITPKRVFFYNKINKTYFKGDFMVLKKVLGIDVDFLKLQNLLVGETIYNLQVQKYKSELSNNAYLLMPAKQKTLFDLFFWINPKHFKVDRQEIFNKEKNQHLQISYRNYGLVSGVIFPKNIEIKARENKKTTTISLEYRSVFFDRILKTPYRVPRGYKRIVFK